MLEQSIQIEVQPLKVELKTTFRHAGATRDKGESVWVKAERGGIAGFGEGCPRPYVTGENLDSSIRWIRDKASKGDFDFKSFEDVKGWTERNSEIIDTHLSAWCAVEMALLDLFAREQNCSIEEMMGLNGLERRGSYTAVLGEDKKWRFSHLVDHYLLRGFTDFKVKLIGRLEKDKLKLEILKDLCGQHSVASVRIRLDANNLWAGRSQEAIAHLNALDGPIFAVEEPVAPRDYEGMCAVSAATGLPIILDDSLCTLNDLALYRNAKGKFIANIKVSRVGGLIRALKLIEEVKQLGWSIIIGCHVGETSLLTRAGLLPACTAGENLIAQEGAFGDYLVEREPVDPVLKFGRNGLLDLGRPYYLKTDQGLRITPEKNWDVGFGLQCRMPKDPDDGQPEIFSVKMPDNYEIHSRVWGSKEGEDVLVILHGGMSHSGWQAPLAKALRSISHDLSVIAPDRRGCGLNANRGDQGSVRLVTEDVVRFVEFLKGSFNCVHLAGWCQGCQYASIAAAELSHVLSSLILLTPGFFWNERFRSVITVGEKIIRNMISEFNLDPERDQAYVPIPMEPTDFTFDEKWLDFIERDQLKTTAVTMKTVNIMDEVQEMSWGSILQNSLPTLVVLAESDRIVDNDKVLQFIGHMFSGSEHNRLVRIESGHAIQFERPEEVAGEIFRFIRRDGKGGCMRLK